MSCLMSSAGGEWPLLTAMGLKDTFELGEEEKRILDELTSTFPSTTNMKVEPLESTENPPMENRIQSAPAIKEEGGSTAGNSKDPAPRLMASISIRPSKLVEMPMLDAKNPSKMAVGKIKKEIHSHRKEQPANQIENNGGMNEHQDYDGESKKNGGELLLDHPLAVDELRQHHSYYLSLSDATFDENDEQLMDYDNVTVEANENIGFRKEEHADEEHMEPEEVPERPFVCPIDDCPSSFDTIDLLKEHKNSHSLRDAMDYILKKNHGLDTRVMKQILKSIHGKRPFVCNVCMKIFATSSGLKRHERKHSGEKPFTCETCGKSFSQSGNLKKHLRVHSGEKPFGCDKCESKFTQKVSLN